MGILISTRYKPGIRHKAAAGRQAGWHWRRLQRRRMHVQAAQVALSINVSVNRAFLQEVQSELGNGILHSEACRVVMSAGGGGARCQKASQSAPLMPWLWALRLGRHKKSSLPMHCE